MTVTMTEQQLAAVQQDGRAIQWIRNPSEPVQLAAVQQDPRAIQCILTPCLFAQLMGDYRD